MLVAVACACMRLSVRLSQESLSAVIQVHGGKWIHVTPTVSPRLATKLRLGEGQGLVPPVQRGPPGADIILPTVPVPGQSSNGQRLHRPRRGGHRQFMLRKKKN